MITAKPTLIDEVLQLINNSVILVAETMLDVQAAPMTINDVRASNAETVMGSVGFTGDISAVVYLHLSAVMAKKFAGKMLGMSQDEIADDMVNDVVGEISNMVVGSVKSQLCDSGSPCALTIPTIVRGRSLSIEPVSTSKRRYLCFNCGGDDRLLVELQMKLGA